MFTLADNASDDQIDVRAIISRIETLYAEIERFQQHGDPSLPSELAGDYEADARSEIGTLEAFLASIASNEGYHKWKGAWYPTKLIRESHFGEFTEEVAGRNLYGLPEYIAIDWPRTAANLRAGYKSCVLYGVIYWYR